MAASLRQGHIIMPTTAPSTLLPSMEQLSALTAEWDKVPSPYIAEGFKKALKTTSLTLQYPSLVQNIKFGSPIGAPTPLLHTTIISTRLCPDIVSDYIAKEVMLGHMASPFTQEETHLVAKGHFSTVPVGLVEKDPSKGTFHMIQHFSKEDELGISVNLQIYSDDFPTYWNSAYTMVEYVRHLPC